MPQRHDRSVLPDAAGIVRRTTLLIPIDPNCTILLEQEDKCPMFAIDVSDRLPLYAQLERAIRIAIATGRLRKGDKLPTVRQLAVDLRINANTVAKVYGELEREGVLETQRGVGTFVHEMKGPAGSRPDREQQMMDLADRFLAGAAALGFSTTEAVDFLETRCIDIKREKSNA
jgi:GntR family transcriptional regulator